MAKTHKRVSKKKKKKQKYNIYTTYNTGSRQKTCNKSSTNLAAFRKTPALSCQILLDPSFIIFHVPACDWLFGLKNTVPPWTPLKVTLWQQKAVVDLQIVMSWCPPWHHPPCSSLLLMSEPPLLLFSPSTSLLFLSLFYSLFLLFLSHCHPPPHTHTYTHTHPASLPPSSGVSLSSPLKAERQRIRASSDMTCRRRLWQAVGTHTLDRRREGSSAPTNETPDCSDKHTLCVCVCVCEGACGRATLTQHKKKMNIDAEIMNTKTRKEHKREGGAHCMCRAGGGHGKVVRIKPGRGCLYLVL